ncbi:MAG: hypothetical protein JNM76_17015 [Betaproteobacteria bacterium]|nr:hypothetical protein [Betaproteobacteria bacterium]
MRTNLKDRIRRRVKQHPAVFNEFIDHVLDRDDKKVLVCPANEFVLGGLKLEWTEALVASRVACILFEGNLDVTGMLSNESLSGGPMLIVDGDLHCGALDKGGAYLLVLGDLICEGVVLCEYNDGVLRVGGAVQAQALISLDQDVYVEGGVQCPYLDWEDDLRAAMVDEAFDLENDPEAVTPDGDRIRQRLRAGAPILRDATPEAAAPSR